MLLLCFLVNFAGTARAGLAVMVESFHEFECWIRGYVWLCFKLPKAISVKPSKNYFIEKTLSCGAHHHSSTTHSSSIVAPSVVSDSYYSSLAQPARPVCHNCGMVYNFFKPLGRDYNFPSGKVLTSPIMTRIFIKTMFKVTSIMRPLNHNQPVHFWILFPAPDTAV